MKKTIALLISLGFSLAFAQEETATSTISTETVSITQSPWIASANLETTSFDYKEPGVMTVTGRLNGVSGQLQYKSDSSLWFQGNAKYLAGSANYDGSYDNGMPATSTDNFRVFDVAAKAMVLTDLGVDVQTSLFLGLGRRMTQDLDDASPSDYYRQHIYNYYSLGLNVLVPHNELSASTFTFGLDTMYSGTSESRLSNVASYYPDFTVDFKGGSALNLEWQLSHRINGLNLFGGLAYQKWNLNESEVATVVVRNRTRYYVEPKNETSTMAVKLGAQF